MRDKKSLGIARIYQWNVENTGLFFFIKAQQQSFPGITIQQAMNNFRKFTGITVDEWDDESMRATYTRLQKQYYENSASDSKCLEPEGSFSK